jgi:signal transduction histidine kinase
LPEALALNQRNPSVELKTAMQISKPLYITGLAFISIGLIYGLISDISLGNTFSVINNSITLAVVILSIILTSIKKIGLNTGLGMVVYISSYTWLAEIINRLYSENFAMQALVSLLAAVTFMSVAAFLLNKVASIVMGITAVIVITIATILSNSEILVDNIPYLILFLFGLSFMLVYYRRQLEGLFSSLHDAQNDLKNQRDTMASLKDKAEHALEDLKKAQKKIIIQEKMASLGSLTAGIAHEIKNPLNFVNNFSESSIELLDELKEHLDKVSSHFSEDDQEDVDYLFEELHKNMEEINTHGKRGDRIVKNMLMHSRGGSSGTTREGLNELLEECSHLAFHGMRAQDSSFHGTVELDLSATEIQLDMIRPDLSRVFLNLINNALYAVNKRYIDEHDSSYEPVVVVRSKQIGNEAQIEIEDNGIGIPREAQEKIFTPFFTTKPTGKGTGLGLSISFDIVTQEHGGKLDLQSMEGSFTKFTISLPLHHTHKS